jgi:LacI family transcriptional regulator
VRAATIRDVAQAAGLSTATVSRVLNDEASVSPATALRVRAEVERLGYTMNQVARSLKTRSTRTVGVVAPELASDFFMLLAESMDRELSAHGYSLIVCSSWESAEEEAKRMRLLAERLVDGLVVIPSTGDGGRMSEAAAPGMPLVLVDRFVPGIVADAVLVDNEGGAYAATTALATEGLAEGRRRMGFIGAGLELSTARERYEGWRRAMQDLGLPIEPAFTSFAGLHVDSGYEALKAMRSRPDAPDAYFLVNAYVHVGATNYLVSEEAPERSAGVVFAAFDETPYAPLLRFCRYSLSQPVAELGAQAARILLARIGGDQAAFPETVRLSASLIRHSRGDARTRGEIAPAHIVPQRFHEEE